LVERLAIAKKEAACSVGFDRLPSRLSFAPLLAFLEPIKRSDPAACPTDDTRLVGIARIAIGIFGHPFLLDHMRMLRLRWGVLDLGPQIVT
jgi:hypothetical protein